MGLVAASSAHAAPGDLDLSFGTGGTQITDFGGGFAGVNDVVVQPDGRVVAAGRSGDGFALARYAADGSLDPTFSGDGKQTLDFGGSDEAFGLVVQADGKIVVVGLTFAGTASDFAIARFNSDGSPDITFSDDGKQQIDLAGADNIDIARDVAVQPDGRLIIAGGAAADFGVVRLDTDGSLDTSFSDDGKQVIDPGGEAEATGLALQADGRILVAGIAAADFGVVRLDTDGSLDTSFSDDGKHLTDFGASDFAMDITIQDDGRIIAAGGSKEGASSKFALARYSSDGTLDATFSEDGQQTTDFPGDIDIVSGVAIDADGKVVAAGGLSDALSGEAPPYDFTLARYNPDGSLDTSFADDGKQTTDLGGFETASGGLALQPDGKIVVAGTKDNDFLLARYLAGGDAPPVDTTPPDTEITAGPAEGSTIDDRTPTFEFSSSEAGSSFRCRIDGGAEFGCASPFTTGELADGAHSFSVAATDAANNSDATPATRSFTVSVPQDPAPQEPAQDPAPQPPAPQPPAPQPPAPVQLGPPVEGDPGYTYPAKLRVARAEVDREDRKLDVYAPLTSRAFGDDVDVTFRAAGRTGEYNVSVTSGDAAFDRIRFQRTITREQANLGTGIVTISYPGNEVTRPQEVRLRAARNQADLNVEEISLQGDRLSAQGTINDEARGVVRLELSYLDVQGRAQVFKTNVEIDDGEWTVDDVVVPTEIASNGAYVSVLFTGYFERRIRGEMISYEIDPGQTRRPE